MASGKRKRGRRKPVKSSSPSSDRLEAPADGEVGQANASSSGEDLAAAPAPQVQPRRSARRLPVHTPNEGEDQNAEDGGAPQGSGEGGRAEGANTMESQRSERRPEGGAGDEKESEPFREETSQPGAVEPERVVRKGASSMRPGRRRPSSQDQSVGKYVRPLDWSEPGEKHQERVPTSGENAPAGSKDRRQPGDGEVGGGGPSQAERDPASGDASGDPRPAQEQVGPVDEDGGKAGTGEGSGGAKPVGKPETRSCARGRDAEDQQGAARKSRSALPKGASAVEGEASAKGPERRDSGRRRPAGKEAAAPGGDAGVEQRETGRGHATRGRGTRKMGAATRPAPTVQNPARRKRKVRGTRELSVDGPEEDAFVDELDGLGTLDGEEDAETPQQSESRDEDKDEGEEREEEEEDEEEGGGEEEEETEDVDESEGGSNFREEGAGEEEAEKKRKTRVFEVVHWALRSIVKMGMCTLVEGIGLWQLQSSGASTILTGQKETAPGGQSCRLLMGSDVFHAHAPLSGNEEQMAQDGTPEWKIKPEQEEGVICYLKTADHVDKTSKWIDRLMRWNHVALTPLRKVVCGGVVVLPGPVALDLREAGPTVYAMPEGPKKARLAFLQGVAVRDGELGEGHARSELAFIYEYKHPGPPFQVQEFADRAAVERGMQPFRELLRQLKISLDDERFLLKWLVKALRRKDVPALMVQSPFLSRLLFYTFVSPAAVCNLKMHEALPAHSAAALSYVAIKCSDVGATLHTTSPLCSVLEQRQARNEMFERNEVGSPAPPILLDCAPGHIPALAAGAGIGTVRVVRSGLDAAGYRKIDDKYQWDPVARAAVQRSVVFAAVRGVQMLQSDKGLLMQPTSPPLLSELGPQAGKVLKPRLPFKKDTFRQVLLAVLESIEHTDVIAYDSTDSKGVDLSMLFTVVFLRWAPLKWRTFSLERKEWRTLFDEVAQEVAKRGRADIVRERMFQAGQRGSHLGKRIEALGSCSVYDAIASPDKRAEQSGGRRVVRMQIVPDELEAIFPKETLERYRTCVEGGCTDGDGQRHLRDLCALKHRLARRKAMRESPLALFTGLKEKLEARFVEEFSNEEIPFEEPGETADGLEKYVKRLTDDILRLRQRVTAEAEGR